MKPYFATEIFSIPYKNKYIIYAPLKRLAFLVLPSVANLLHEITSKDFRIKYTKDETHILIPFYKLGLINGPIDKLPIPLEKVFAPTFVTIFLTDKCNMRCIYCYASGGEKYNTTIPFETTKAAIDLIIKNGQENGQKEVGVGFHGGGEPTLAWKTLVKTVEYAKNRASESDLKIKFNIATNGIISAKKLDWIMNNFSGLNLSFDGNEDVQNYNRPLASGEASFKLVMDTISRLNNRNFPYGIRSTITASSVSLMPQTFEFFMKECNTRSIHFEPTFSCGRCLYTGVDIPSAKDFIKGFRSAQKIADNYGVSLYYSGSRIDTITMLFCKGAGDSFCVTPQGDVTSCYEICSKDDPRSEIFFYGRYNHKLKKFEFFQNKLKYLRMRTINNIPYCEDCFCKYHCAGDCLSKTSDCKDLMAIKNPIRCKINQTLTLDKIIKMIDGSGNIHA
jgi:uncharacterized protein